jgi:hypothetical protein
VVVVVGPDDWMQVDETCETSIYLRTVLGTSFGELVPSAGLIGLEIDEDGAGSAKRDCLEHALDAGDGRIVAAAIEELDVLKNPEVPSMCQDH